MKKYKQFLIILIIIMIIPFIIKTFEKKHKVKYKINNYNIEESFYINKKDHIYDFYISNKKEKYSYTLIENINKRKKVIKEIKLYKSNNITCIMPIYKKDISKNIYCRENNKQVSNYYLKNNKDFNKILNKVKKYNIKKPTSSNDKIEYKKLKVFQKNIMNNYSYIIWNYKGIYILRNDELKYQKLIDYDLYDNIMSTITSRYYVLFENSNVMGIENIHYYDLKKDKYNIFKLKKKISKNSYINGVIDDLIYVTDNDKKIEYTINIKKKKIEVVGKDEEYIKYSNGKKEILNKSDFFMNNQLFNNEIINEEIIEGNNKYKKQDNKIYKTINKKNIILLFELDNIKSWYVYNRDIILIKDDELYTYNDETGLRKIVEYNELKYNDDKLTELWK